MNRARQALEDIRIWEGLTSEKRLGVALDVAEVVRPLFTFIGLKTHSLGGVTHEIAFFTHEEAEFALLPGHPSATLGYDLSDPFTPSAEQAEDFRLYTQTELHMSLEEFLETSQTPLREATIRPFFLEVGIHKAGYVALSARDGEDAECHEVDSALNGLFRLPTTDEWEYACAAGTRTLFRWGNDTPPQSSYFASTWDLHKQRNAFGLYMNSDTYDVELCEGEIFRGGDGGSAVCGGFGDLYSWVPLASTDNSAQLAFDPADIDEVLIRRAYSLEGI